MKDGFCQSVVELWDNQPYEIALIQENVTNYFSIPFMFIIICS